MEEEKHFVLNFVIMVSVVVIALFVVNTLKISYPLTIISTTRSSELAVVGEGSIEVKPDTAYVDAGITVDNRLTIEKAQEEIRSVNNKIIDSLKKIGIKKENIKTSNYSVYPNYNYKDGENSIKGYGGNATIEIKVIDTELVSQVIEKVAESGANQIQGVRFAIDKPENYREKARDKAIENAKIQAKKLASDLGISLGKITNIVESSPAQISNDYLPRAAGVSGLGEDAPMVEIEEGIQTVSSTVTLYFEKH